MPEIHLKEGNMVHNGPVGEALGVAEVAQVVAVAEQLIGDLGVAHGGTVHMVVHRLVALDQTLGQVAQMMQHLHADHSLDLALQPHYDTLND